MDAMREIFARESEALINNLAARLEKGQPSGNFSPSIYDTAWLARIRTRDTPSHWLFPECFTYLIRTQEPDGGWPVHGSEIDGVLNTLAALVALKEHQATHLDAQIINGFHPDSLEERIVMAEATLGTRLKQWDVEATVHVGFEVVVPALLKSLEADGTTFNFPGRHKLMLLNQQKLSKLRPEIVYGPQMTTLVHSLEALVGRIDFDRVSHHLDQHGSMLASPASTAAYLMHSSKWDDRAEAYLTTVVASGSGAGSGGVPGAFPSATFELSWILSTLLKATPSLAKSTQALRVAQYLQDELNSHGGVVGWDTALLDDADDTAKVLLSSTLLGLPTSPKRMIEKFEGADHFRTYQYERNGSFSTNCNVLMALLHYQNPTDYHDQITKVAKFLCREYLSGTINDKWNLCDGYSTMLLAQALSKLLHVWDSGLLTNLPEELIREQVPMVMSHILVQTLQLQSSDGSWQWKTVSRETTAYAILTIKCLASLPWLARFDSQIQTTVRRGSAYLILNYDNWDSNEYLWVAKATYALPPVARAYIVASLCAETSYHWGSTVIGLFAVSDSKALSMAGFYGRLPMFESDGSWLLESDLALGHLHRARLSQVATSMFPPNPGKEADNKYLDYIPFTWIATNRKNGVPLSQSALWEMMKISVLIYQLDELMETVCSRFYKEGDIEQLRVVVRSLCPLQPLGHDRGLCCDASDNSISNGRDNGAQTNGNSSAHDTLHTARKALLRFTFHILSHPAVSKSPPRVHEQLRRELLTSILAHIDHEEQNIHFRQSSPAPPTTLPYHTWIRNISAPNTQAPWTFLFFTCLANPAQSLSPKAPFFHGPRQEYLACALTNHLSALCRQQNDYGSVARDKQEGNLNSINFLTREGSPEDAKEELLYIAEYEKECLNLTLAKLKAEMVSQDGRRGQEKGRTLQMFVDTVELYGQIYCARDISNRQAHQ
ncbi:hypothetical protein QBC40DRAFT_304347 [Triangularia verruculosa]|uniref:Uncharacterized protein n=1 Tax=Triangularia verruculosa TaxID=2587418 RepID=A0AAN6XRR7_9PEZI|nr:hypothetical protein QBC40DRAFT_304347 [Triangularia verruculosa]